MRKLKIRTGISFLGALTLASLLSPSLFAADSGKWQQDLDTWRTNRREKLLAPDGWFSLVGLDWLQPGKNTVGKAADNRIHLTSQNAPDHLGILDLENGKVQLLPPAGGFPAGLTVNDKPALSTTLTEKDNLRISTLTLIAIQRGDRFALRSKDADAPTRKQFHGLNWYAPDARYRVTARWIPYTPQHEVAIPTIIGTTEHEKVPGAAEFSVDGKTVHLEPIVEDNKLFFILRDTTSRSTTYGAARFLYTDFPANGLDKPGELVLDFNRLQNPPCAYTPYATCPLPPEQNRLAVAFPVGEKRYHE